MSIHGDRLARITVTVPPALVEAADAIAWEEGRSRSWVVAEALTRLVRSRARERVAPMQAQASSGVAGPERVPEAGPAFAKADFEAVRGDRLAGDLALSPEERVREAEALAATAELVHPAVRTHQVIVFESPEAYLAWKRHAWRT